MISYNIFSFLFGIIALFFPFVSIYRHSFGIINLISISACALSLQFQLVEVEYLINVVGDFSALMDTIHAVVVAGGTLLSFVILVNTIAFINSKKRSMMHKPLC